MGLSREMPKYRCHKEVWALKIKDILYTSSGSGAVIIPEDQGHSNFRVSTGYIEKHKPTVGGYYVQYRGGYESFSPAISFEEGYSKI